ncbi:MULTISPECIES: ALF repeat-containing protein [unclassified Streptomyces]|uniref:ALF repeat-containing protein n=1 Tax=unclassified Streptomyces TaxID=2593676 RepID=UPI00366595CF
MRLTRATLAVAAGALAPALLLSTPSLAATATTPSIATAAAAAADTGSPYDEMDADDLRIAILRILADPDSSKRVTREANELLDDGTVEEMRAWLETGYRLAQAEDDRVAIARILADPNISEALRAAANAALDDNTPEARRYFLEVGQYEVDG